LISFCFAKNIRHSNLSQEKMVNKHYFLIGDKIVNFAVTHRTINFFTHQGQKYSLTFAQKSDLFYNNFIKLYVHFAVLCVDSNSKKLASIKVQMSI
jgi:hypothetical protein